ncbi:MAG TPA: hypothetical protein VNI77_00715 [Nitrososphaera sp.]|nr:hypothetical protein [Nitrososphaera sp.]
MFTITLNDLGFAHFAGRVPKDARVAFEATGMTYPLRNALTYYGYDVTVVMHPKELEWIVKSKKKNDKVDSLKISKLHMSGMLPESYLLDTQEQLKRISWYSG